MPKAVRGTVAPTSSTGKKTKGFIKNSFDTICTKCRNHKIATAVLSVLLAGAIVASVFAIKHSIDLEKSYKENADLSNKNAQAEQDIDAANKKTEEAEKKTEEAEKRAEEAEKEKNEVAAENNELKETLTKYQAEDLINTVFAENPEIADKVDLNSVNFKTIDKNDGERNVIITFKNLDGTEMLYEVEGLSVEKYELVGGEANSAEVGLEQIVFKVDEKGMKKTRYTSVLASVKDEQEKQRLAELGAGEWYLNKSAKDGDTFLTFVDKEGNRVVEVVEGRLEKGAEVKIWESKVNQTERENTK